MYQSLNHFTQNTLPLSDDILNDLSLKVNVLIQSDIDIDWAVILGGFALEITMLDDDLSSREALLKNIKAFLDAIPENQKEGSAGESPISEQQTTAQKTAFEEFSLHFDEKMDTSIFEDFIQEISVYLEQIESDLLFLEQNHTAESVNTVYRSFHTIKGLSGYLNITPFTQLAHHTEKYMGVLRDSPQTIDRKIILRLMQVADLFQNEIVVLKNIIFSLKEISAIDQNWTLPRTFFDLTQECET